MSAVILRCRACNTDSDRKRRDALCPNCGQKKLQYWCPDHERFLDDRNCPECDDPESGETDTLPLTDDAFIVLRCQNAGLEHPREHVGPCSCCNLTEFLLPYCTRHREFFRVFSCVKCHDEIEQARIGFFFEPAELDAGVLQIGSTREVTASVRKIRAGYLRGALEADVPWLSLLEEKTFGIKGDRAKSVKLRVTSPSLAPGTRAEGHLLYKANWGEKRLTVFVTTAAPPLQVGGREARNPRELAAALAADWEAGLRLYEGRQIQQWLARCAAPPLPSGGSPGEILLKFVAGQDPALRPSLGVQPPAVMLGPVESGASKRFFVFFRNAGAGSFAARLALSSPALQMVKRTASCRNCGLEQKNPMTAVCEGCGYAMEAETLIPIASSPKAVEFEIRSEGLPCHAPVTERIELQSEWGRVSVPVSFTPVPAPLKVGTELVRTLPQLVKAARADWDALLAAARSGELNRWARSGGVPEVPPPTWPAGSDGEAEWALALQHYLVSLDGFLDEGQFSSRPTLAFEPVEGRVEAEVGAPCRFTLKAWNAGVGPLRLTIRPEDGWLKPACPDLVKVLPGRTRELEFHAEPEGAKPGQVFRSRLLFETLWGVFAYAVAVTVTPPVLRLESGAVRSREELMKSACTAWEELLRAWMDGRLKRWLLLSGLPASVPGATPNEQVQNLLKGMDPALAPRPVVVEGGVLDLGTVNIGTVCTKSVKLANAGVGDLFAQLRTEADWISFSDGGRHVLRGPGVRREAAIMVKVRPDMLGGKRTALVRVETACGLETVRVTVEPVRVPLDVGGKPVRSLEELAAAASAMHAMLARRVYDGKFDEWVDANGFRKGKVPPPVDDEQARVQYALQSCGLAPAPAPAWALSPALLEGQRGGPPMRAVLTARIPEGCLYGLARCRDAAVTLDSRNATTRKGVYDALVWTASPDQELAISIAVDPEKVPVEEDHPITIDLETNAGVFRQTLACRVKPTLWSQLGGKFKKFFS